MFQECSTLARFSLGPLIRSVVCYCSYTEKKENQSFLIYEDIQSGAVAKSYMTNGLLIYGEYLSISSYIRKPFLIHDCSTLNFFIYEEFDFLFYQGIMSSEI